jgi:hypothetical protein
LDASRFLSIRRSRREFLFISAGLILAACKKGASGSGNTAVATQAPSGSTSTEPTRAAPTTAPAPTATTRPESIEIRGNDDFKNWTQQALDLLKAKTPPHYQLVMDSIWVIESVTAGSGMVVQEKRFKVGDETAHAPGHPAANQLVWYASTIVHDANHSALFMKGQTYSGKDAEVACLKVQKEALLKIENGNYFANYVQGLIDGADDPKNQYWNQPNRHW